MVRRRFGRIDPSRIESSRSAAVSDGRSDYEVEMERALSFAGLPAPLLEFRFAARRAWRFDFAWPYFLVALEVEGGTWAQGRHTRGAGFEADCRKYAEAALGGWLVLRVTGGMVESGEALELCERALQARGWAR